MADQISGQGWDRSPGSSEVFTGSRPGDKVAQYEFFGVDVQISWIYVGIPYVDPARDLSATQTLGDFSQTASAEVQVDASATQTLGDFGQTATAEARVDASADQTLGDFTQTATAESDQPVPPDVQISWLYLSLPYVEQVPVVDTPAASVTPGADTRSARYRVRVGKRWLYVDPLDPSSVRAAMQAAEDAAEKAADGPTSDPQAAAVRAIGVAPARASSVDYAGLRAESERIAEQVRAVYAQALQREFIARLMRDEMDRDEDESVLLLLG